MLPVPDLSGPFRARLDSFIQAAKSIHGGDVEALHATRVASRRLRELVPLLGLDHDKSRKLTRRLGSVTGRLGRVRELDVLMLLIDTLSRDSRYSSALEHLGSGVTKARVTAHDRLVKKLPLAKLERLGQSLERAASHLESDAGKRRQRGAPGPRYPWLLALEARRASRASRLRSAIDTAGVVHLPHRLHHVRVALKKLRYACELWMEVRRQRATADIETLKVAQDVLGYLNDREVLIDRARRLQASICPSDHVTCHQLGSLVRVLEDDCRRLHARYMRDRVTLIRVAERMKGTDVKPEAIVRRSVAS